MWKQILRFLKKGRVLLTGMGVFFFLTVYVTYDLPSVESISQNLNPASVRIVDRNQRPLYELLPTDGGRHAALDFQNIPQCMKDATIAVEDKSFYTNPGVDLQGLLRALWINLKGGEVLAGGSTITQQVARTLLLSADERTERTLRRKTREMILAWELTRNHSKNEILALYLNQVYYGGMAYGIDAASRTYFGKPPEDLLLPECALLAGLPQTPGVYNPFTNPDLAVERQHVVLGLMEAQGFITEVERIQAQNAPLSYNSQPYPIEAPHFIWLIKDQLDELVANGTLGSNQGLVVQTTLDLDRQQVAEGIIARRLAAFKTGAGEISQNVNNASLVVLNPRNGEILVMVGSADYFDAGIDGALNMATSPRQSGSAFKPIIYATALDPNRSEPLTAASALLDVSTTFVTRDGEPYRPMNYDRREHGYVSVREALGSSLNIPAVLTLEQVGIEDVVDLAHRLGIQSLSAPGVYDLSLALGGGEMSLLELAGAMSTLGNQGLYTGIHSILEIRDADGDLLYVPLRPAPLQVIDPRAAWLINDILSDDRARGIGFGSNSILNVGRTAAVKTGTTTNFHDNWTVGYTPDMFVGVWVGNSNYEAMHNVSGLTGAAPIWHETMRALLEGLPDRQFTRPAGMTQLEICSLSGSLPTPECDHTRLEWFIEGTQPLEYDTFHKQIWLDSLTGRIADETTPPERQVPLKVLDLPLQAQEWARKAGFPLIGDYLGTAGTAPEILLALPDDGGTYRIDPAYDLASQRIAVEAWASREFTRVTLYADGKVLGDFTSPPFQAWWTLTMGEHEFWAVGSLAGGTEVASDVSKIQVIE